MLKRIKNLLFQNQTARQTVAKNAFWLTVSDIGGRALRVLIIIYAARVLGVASWGAASYALSIAAFLTIFTDFGVGSVLTREAAKAKDDTERSDIIGTTFILKLALLAAGILLIWVAGPYLTSIGEIRMILPIAALVLAGDTIRGFANSVARSAERMEREAFFFLATNVLIVAFGFFALALSPSARTFMWAYAAGVMIGAGISFISLKPYFSKLFSSFSRPLASRILQSAWPFALSAFMGGLMINTDLIVIGFFRSAEEIGFYSAAEKPIQLLYLFPAIIAASIFPMLSKLAKRDDDSFRKLLEKALLAVLLLALPITFGGMFVAGNIISFLFGSAYLPAETTFIILLFTLAFNFPAVVMSNALFAHDKKKTLATYAALAGISNLAFDLVLIPVFGIAGSALATFAAQVISNAYLWKEMRKTSSFSIMPRMKNVFVATALMSVCVFLFTLAETPLLITLAASGAIYFAALFLLREPMLRDALSILKPRA